VCYFHWLGYGWLDSIASFVLWRGGAETYLWLVSRYGLVAFASSLDQIGPFANSVKDAATLLGVMAGHDPLDSTSLEVPIPDYPRLLTEDLTQSLKGKKIGVITETFGEGLSEEVATAVKKAIAHLESMGAEIKEISCPRFAYGLPTYYIIAPSEASANLARYDGVKYGFRQPDIDNLIGDVCPN
jgi:aspartyl-tRNA(Asn)/glutamyl-tRNA(Gln) amidotransferase subunit A